MVVIGGSVPKGRSLFAAPAPETTRTPKCRLPRGTMRCEQREDTGTSPEGSPGSDTLRRPSLPPHKQKSLQTGRSPEHPVAPERMRRSLKSAGPARGGTSAILEELIFGKETRGGLKIVEIVPRSSKVQKADHQSQKFALSRARARVRTQICSKAEA